MSEDVGKMKKGGLMISAKKFDEKFEKGENIDKYLDLENPLTLEDIVEEQITLSLPTTITNKIIDIAKNLNLSIEDTIKVLLAKEVGVL